MAARTVLAVRAVRTTTTKALAMPPPAAIGMLATVAHPPTVARQALMEEALMEEALIQEVRQALLQVTTSALGLQRTIVVEKQRTNARTRVCGDQHRVARTVPAVRAVRTTTTKALAMPPPAAIGMLARVARTVPAVRAVRTTATKALAMPPPAAIGMLAAVATVPKRSRVPRGFRVRWHLEPADLHEHLVHERWREQQLWF